MGTAYRAFDKERGQEVVLKFIRRELFGDRKSSKRFSREVFALKRLSHPSIVEVFDFIEDHEPPFFTMEFVDGESLAELTERGPMDVRRLIEIIRPISSALAHCHDLTIIHRDIKPDNIVLSRKGLAKLIDFGLASQQSEEPQTQLTKTGEVLGTLEFLPPEIICGAKSDERSDIYQLGVVLYMALAGRPPFSADNIVAFARNQRSTKVPSLTKLNDRVDERLDGIVARCMAIDPDLRYQSAKALHRDLDRWYTESRPTHPPKRPLSDMGRIGHTGKVGAVTKSKPVAKARGALKMLGLGLFVLLALFALFYTVESGLPNEQNRVAITHETIRKMQLISLKKVELQYLGPQDCQCEIKGLSNEPILVSLKNGEPLSRTNYRLVIDLPHPILKERTATVTPLNSKKVALRRAMGQFRLSPKAYLSSVLAPLDALKSETLTLLLKDLQDLSERHPRDGDIGDGRARVRALLRKHSIGEDEVLKLEQHIPSIIKTPIFLDSEIAERMYALFLIDVALANSKTLSGPWGRVYHHFGLVFSRGDKAYRRISPWLMMCHRDILRSTECHLGAITKDNSPPRLPAIFLVSADTFNRFTIRSTLFQEVHRELPKFLFQEGEIRPAVPRGLRQKAELIFPVDKEPKAIKEAVFTITVAGFVRGTLLRLSMNEGPSMMVVNSATFDNHQWDMNVSIPIEPSSLKKGDNVCTATREMIGVFDRSSDLLAIKAYGLWVRYHEGKLKVRTP